MIIVNEVNFAFEIFDSSGKIQSDLQMGKSLRDLLSLAAARILSFPSCGC